MTRHQIEPVLQTFAGWNQPTDAVKLSTALPATMNEYVAFINKYIGIDISHISNGPGREQIVIL